MLMMIGAAVESLTMKRSVWRVGDWDWGVSFSGLRVLDFLRFLGSVCFLRTAELTLGAEGMDVVVDKRPRKVLLEVVARSMRV